MSTAPLALCLAGTILLSVSAPAIAQAPPTVPATTPGGVRTVPQSPPSSVILPTDVLPLPSVQNRLTFGENLQLRILQKLPASFYFTSSVESSFRYETNVFQFPTKRTLIRQLGGPATFRAASPQQQLQISQTLARASSEDVVFRVLPNVTAGFTLTPHTRVFGNYFMISDTLMRNHTLNTVINSYAGGIQQDFPIGRRANLQLEFQCRELTQSKVQPVFDYLPGITASVVITPRLVGFLNTLVQLRGKKPFQAPTREIDPFYTWGFLYQRGGWNFSASSTFVQNFREPFRRNASIPINNYAFICDFEVARRLVPAVPGLQAFVRAEPIFNFKSNNTPGLAGTDFRLFWGMRFAATKPSLTMGLQQLKQQIEEQEGEPPTPPGGQTKPSASIPAYEYIAMHKQPIHGAIPVAEDLPMPLLVKANSEIAGAGPPVHCASDTNSMPAVEAEATEKPSATLTAERPVVMMQL
jgi:hypothetical protein